MRAHYFMWVIIALSFMMLGALYRGHEDLLKEDARIEGAAIIINQLSVKELSELSI